MSGVQVMNPDTAAVSGVPVSPPARAQWLFALQTSCWAELNAAKAKAGTLAAEVPPASNVHERPVTTLTPESLPALQSACQYTTQLQAAARSLVTAANGQAEVLSDFGTDVSSARRQGSMQLQNAAETLLAAANSFACHLHDIDLDMKRAIYTRPQVALAGLDGVLRDRVEVARLREQLAELELDRAVLADALEAAEVTRA